MKQYQANKEAQNLIVSAIALIQKTLDTQVVRTQQNELNVLSLRLKSIAENAFKVINNTEEEEALNIIIKDLKHEIRILKKAVLNAI